MTPEIPTETPETPTPEATVTPETPTEAPETPAPEATVTPEATTEEAPVTPTPKVDKGTVVKTEAELNAAIAAAPESDASSEPLKSFLMKIYLLQQLFLFLQKKYYYYGSRKRHFHQP